MLRFGTDILFNHDTKLWYPIWVAEDHIEQCNDFNSSVWFPVGDKMVDPATGLTVPRFHVHYWTYTLPHEYPVEDITQLHDYLNSILTHEDQSTLKSFLRTALLKKHSSQQILQLFGGPNSGKSTLRIIIENAFDRLSWRYAQRIPRNNIPPDIKKARLFITDNYDYENHLFPQIPLSDIDTPLMVCVERPSTQFTHTISLLPFTRERMTDASLRSLGTQLLTWILN
jgi:hypothetical protein